jgi:hypothetical protein
MALTSAGQAQTIDFEAPLYSTGNLTTTTTGGASNPGAFDGVNGWARSGSGGLGAIVTTTSSGLYQGGQALGSGAANNAYIGANNTFVLGAKFSFDILAPTANKAGVSGFADINKDGMVTYTTENGIFAGILDSSGAKFAFRDLGIGGSAYYSTVNANNTDWYRITVTLDDPTYTATMDVINLTQGGTVVDLNPTGEGTSFSHTWTGGTGWIPASSFTGVGARASAGILIDNITNIPEPGSGSLALLGGLALLGNRLRRRN